MRMRPFIQHQSGLTTAQVLGALAGGFYAPAINKDQAQRWLSLKQVPYPQVTGSRPDDSLLFSDPFSYLRIVADNADWDGVARWYATQIQLKLKETTEAQYFWELALLRVQDHATRLFNLGDFHAFTEKCIRPMVVLDLGREVGFGYTFNATDENFGAWLYKLSAGGGHLWRDDYDNVAAGHAAGFALGWQPEADPHTASKIMVAVGAAFMGAAAFSALTAPAVAANTAAEAAAVAATETAAAAVPLETVVITASALPSITTAELAAASALAAGATAFTGSAPSVSSAPATPPAVEEVITTATALPIVSAGEVAAAAASAVAASVAAAETASAPANTYMDSVETAPQETVTVESQAIQPTEMTPGEIAVDAAAAAAALLALNSPPVETVTTESTHLETEEPGSNITPVLLDAGALLAAGLLQPGASSGDMSSGSGDSYGNDQVQPPSEATPNASWLDLLNKLGLDALKNLLTQLAKYYLGRALSPGEQGRYNDYFTCLQNGGTQCVPPKLDNGSTLTPNGVTKENDWLIYLVIALVLAALLASHRSKKRGKPRRKKS